MRIRAKVDTNQKSIVAALRKCGFQVAHLHQLGKGVPDILVGASGTTAVACRKGKQKRNFIGFELSEKYHSDSKIKTNNILGMFNE
jgi:hypothetical protein